MQYRKLGKSGIEVSVLSLGTWAFGGDNWWGTQLDRDSVEALERAISGGVNMIDTAPVYGRGRSETVIGSFVKKRNLREKVLLATKVGLSWDGPKILHNLKKKRIYQELDESRLRLKTDYFDLYQVHWPDPDTPVGESAEVMHSLYQGGIIKAVGVSNYSVSQMQEFMKYSPLHSLQPEYSMFNRAIESDVVDFCLNNEIAIISYAPLYSGILTGKFFFDKVAVPNDTNRKMKQRELTEPLFSINKDILTRLKDIAAGYNKNLTQLAINWNFSQAGITSAITGARRLSQLEDNLGSVGWQISSQDMSLIKEVLDQRLVRKKAIKRI